MSSEAVASVFMNLDPGTAALIDEIKAFLDSNQFINQDNAEEHAQIGIETTVYQVMDADGTKWAGRDYRNAVVTPYYSSHEDLTDTIEVLVGIEFRDDGLKTKEGVLITINNYEDYSIPHDCSWDDVKGLILGLMGGCSSEDEAADLPAKDDGNIMPVIEGVDSNATPDINRRKISFCSKISVREFSQSPEIPPIDFTEDIVSDHRIDADGRQFKRMKA